MKYFLTCKYTGQRLDEVSHDDLKPSSDPEKLPRVTVSRDTRFQEIKGFGGAFTESAASTFDRLDPSLQNEVLEAYFDPKKGHGYSLGRTHINSCDFSLGNYAYSEVNNDTGLDNFTIERDKQSLIPLIKKAMSTAGQPLQLLASPWSPPAWMKSNGEMNNGGKLKPEYRKTWASYYGRYIAEYATQGIPIWAVSVQNEPEATQTWDSCRYTAEEERDFVRDYLGPELESHGPETVKIVVWDHNRDLMYDRARAILSDPEAARHIWGVGFHWYGPDCFDNVQKTHDEFPDKKLIFTEGCQEGGPHIGSWKTGERYAHSIINDLNRWTVGWIDWNLFLNTAGGPNHVGNFCSAPIILDTEKQEILYQSSFYYIGHFSRFMRPGSIRVASQSESAELEILAAENNDKSLAVTILNRSESEIGFILDTGAVSRRLSSPPRSIISITEEN